ncbi:MAG: hypothetical protein NVSMB1_17830 [Polyangiales bacterium]
MVPHEGAAKQKDRAAPVVSAPEKDPTVLCSRMCEAQTHCGGSKAKCEPPCLAFARIAETDVVEMMAKCKEELSKKPCDEGASAIEGRKQKLAQCTIDAAQMKDAAAKTNIEVFAKAHCDAQNSCGADPAFSMSNCIGRARATIAATQGKAGGLYGALRRSTIDDLVSCMNGPCDQRKNEADENVERCLDAVLSKASESTL